MWQPSRPRCGAEIDGAGVTVLRVLQGGDGCALVPARALFAAFGVTLALAVPLSADAAASTTATSPTTTATASLPVLYGAAWCGVCRQARAHLQRTHVAYRYIDIDTPEGKRAFEDAGGGSVPLLVRQGKPLRGYSELAYDFFFAP